MADLSLLTRKSDTEWWIEPHGRMRVPGVIYGSEALVRDMDAKVYEQVENVAMLTGGARWAVDRGYGTATDVERIEEDGCMSDAKPEEVSPHAKNRQRDEMGTLGSGNHYLEVQRVATVFDPKVATTFQLREDDIVISIHCGSRGLGHQIGTKFLRRMALATPSYGIELPDRELACAPIRSSVGEAYLGAMRAAIRRRGSGR